MDQKQVDELMQLGYETLKKSLTSDKATERLKAAELLLRATSSNSSGSGALHEKSSIGILVISSADIKAAQQIRSQVVKKK